MIRPSATILVLIGITLTALPAGAADLDTDGDRLSDFQEVHKYRTDPAKADTDGDGIPDGDWNERREHTYTIRAVIRVMRPVARAFLNDDFQDARVLGETEEYLEIEFVHYPQATPAKAIRGSARGEPDPRKRPWLAPGVTTNWDEGMRERLLGELAKSGINPDDLPDAELVRKVSAWLLSVSNHRGMFCTYFVGFSNGKPGVLPGCEQAFEANKGDKTWSTEEQFAHELLGREMFARKTHGTCTSTAVYLTTVLRAVGIPTRMIVCIPVVDASDPAQVRMIENGVAHPEVRRTILEGIKPGSTSFTAHTFNEVFIEGRWHRLNYTKLGETTLNPRYMGLFTHVHTFADLSEAQLAETWGLRYATGRKTETFPFSNPYRTLLVDDLVGPHAEAPRGGGREAPPSRAEHETLTIEHAYWSGEKGVPAWLPRKSIEQRASQGALFLFHVKEWFPDQSYHQLKKFMVRADPSFVLRAKGKPEVPAKLNLWYHTSPNKGGREFEVFIKRDDLQQMEPGVSYRLVPINESRFTWRVVDGVTLTRPE